MMIKDGSKRLVVLVVIGISVISYDVCSIPAAHQELHPARINNERFCAFFGLFWDVLQHNGDLG